MEPVSWLAIAAAATTVASGVFGIAQGLGVVDMVKDAIFPKQKNDIYRDPNETIGQSLDQHQSARQGHVETRFSGRSFS